MTFVAILPIELLSLASGNLCFQYHRTFLTSSLSCEILASLTYSKINVCSCLFKVKVEVRGIEESHIPLRMSLKPVSRFCPSLLTFKVLIITCFITK